MKRAADPRLAVHPDAASHQLDQALRDRQSQPRPAVSPSGRGVRLLERLEDQRLLVRRDADAGIADVKMQRDRRRGDDATAVQCRIAVLRTADIQHDLAAMRELDRVADQIDHDLPQASRVPDERVGHIGRDSKRQFQMFAMRPHRERLHRIPQHLAQAEDIWDEVQFSRLDLREVENVVDDSQQRVARFAHGQQVLALRIGQRRVEHQFGHAEDRIHRRPNLVAHVGQEIALRAIGGLGQFLRLAQRRLGPLAFGDVVDERCEDDAVFRVRRRLERQALVPSIQRPVAVFQSSLIKPQCRDRDLDRKFVAATMQSRQLQSLPQDLRLASAQIFLQPSPVSRTERYRDDDFDQWLAEHLLN